MPDETRDQSELLRFLAGIPLFGGWTDEALAQLAARTETIVVPAGAVLMEEGELGEAMYLVRAGRLRAYVKDQHGEDIPVGEAGRGSISGEMALLTDEPRSATVRALRDTVVVQLKRSDFLDIVRHHPESLLEVTKTLVTRLRDSQHRRPTDSGFQTIALLPANASVDIAGFALHFQLALEGIGEGVATVDRERVGRDFGLGSPDAALASSTYATVSRWLDGFEEQCNRLLYVMDPLPTDWSHRCARQADVIIIVADGNSAPEPGPLEQAIRAAQPETRRELVLVHDPFVDQPSGTAAWLDRREVARHHHVRSSEIPHYSRVARLLCGKAIGLVLSGGGARSFAHIGVIRALMEYGIPIDMAGGASSGAMAACGTALELPIEEIAIRAKRAYRKLVDYTVPIVALARGAGIDEGQRFVLGDDTQIEDFWLNYFCVATDISSGSLRVFDRGPAWWAVRASVSIPGVFPPVVDGEGHTLVDGGLLDNLPVGVMAARVDGFTIGSDLRGARAPLAADLDHHGVVNGWTVAARRLLPFVTPANVPGIAETMMRSIEISSSHLQQEADYMFRPPVERFAALDVSAGDQLIDAGYQHACRRLDEDPISFG